MFICCTGTPFIIIMIHLPRNLWRPSDNITPTSRGGLIKNTKVLSPPQRSFPPSPHFYRMGPSPRWVMHGCNKRSRPGEGSPIPGAGGTEEGGLRALLLGAGNMHECCVAWEGKLLRALV